MQSLQSEDFAPIKPVEMSEKALRYARKAQHHHQAKLKRSMSTHLTSLTEPWVDTTADGRHLYRSSSRHSLMSDTRVIFHIILDELGKITLITTRDLVFRSFHFKLFLGLLILF